MTEEKATKPMSETLSQLATLRIGGMTCATCSGAIEKLLRPMNGIKAANVSLLMNQAKIEYDENIININDIIEEIEDIGFNADILNIKSKNENNNNNKDLNIYHLQKQDIIKWTANIIDDVKENKNIINETLKNNSIPGIIKIKYELNKEFTIYFDKEQIIPMTINHLLQSNDINLENIKLSKVSDDNNSNNNDIDDKIELSQLHKITFSINPSSSEQLNEQQLDDIFDKILFKKKIGENLIESINIKNNNLLIIEYYDNMTENKSTAREIYKYLLSELVNMNIIIIDSQNAERNEFKESQLLQVKKIEKQFKWALVFAIPCFFIAMIFPFIPFIHHLLMYQPFPKYNPSFDLMGILLFLFATPVQFWVGKTFYISSYYALKKNKTTNMSTLIALGTTIAWLYSFIALFIGFIDPSNMALTEASHFFETSSTVITVVLFGKWLQTKAKFKTCDAIELLMEMQSPFTNLVKIDKFGEIIDENEKISTELIIRGDIIKCYQGERISNDGVIIYCMNNGASIDERMITGESIPRTVKIGDKVIASSINIDAPILLIKVTKCKSDSVLSKVIKLMQDSQINKPKQQEIADKISSYFVPIVIIISIITFITWYCLCTLTNYIDTDSGADGNCTFFSILFSMAVMVIACPCALGLAVPTAVMVGIGIATKYGCLIKGGNILEIAHKLDIIVFDKTGTLTHGKPNVVDFVVFEEEEKENKSDHEELLYKIGCTEINSQHPLAKAIVLYAKQELNKLESDYDLKIPEEFTVFPGKGVYAKIDGKDEIYIGNFKWFFDLKQKDSLINKINIELPEKYNDIKEIEQLLFKRNKSGNISLLFCINNKLKGYLCLFDSPRKESKDVIDLLQNKYNLKCIMLTGDNHQTAVAVAKCVGIDEKNVISQVLPQDKHQIIKKLQNRDDNDDKKEMKYDEERSSIPMQSLSEYDKYDISKINIVSMVGDGINDAAALSQSDLGIAIGGGTDIAMEASEVVLMNNNLYNIAMLIDLSSKIIYRIYWNFVWALGYNCLGIPIAAGVLYPVFQLRLPPELAAIAMAASSFSVLISSMLLKTYKSPFNYDKNEDKNNNDNNQEQRNKKCGCGLNCKCKARLMKIDKINSKYVEIGDELSQQILSQQQYDSCSNEYSKDINMSIFNDECQCRDCQCGLESDDHCCDDFDTE